MSCTHKWRFSMHIDGCHSHLTTYVCVHCDEQRGVETERNLDDPYTSMWLMPRDCERCAELVGQGAKAEAGLFPEESDDA